MLFCVMIVGVKLNWVWYFISGYIYVYYAKIRAFRFGKSEEIKRVIFVLTKKDMFRLISLWRQSYLDLCEYVTRSVHNEVSGVLKMKEDVTNFLIVLKK